MAKGEDAELIGKLVGRYRIEKRLGSGGMGEVYLARQVEIGSRVAIKIMSRSSKTDSEGAKRMFAEARAVNLVQHDRIVNVLDMTRIDGRPALIMEYLRGVSLDRLLATGPIPARAIADLAIDILDALSAVHAQEIYHRDLKPGNVYVSPEGRATLLDFGLAKMADDMLGTVIQTQVGMVMGTVPYMAPEQARGEPFTAASDVFAVGVLLYEAATARRPFKGHSIFELLNEHKAGADRPRLLNPAIPVELEEVIVKALALDPADRYPSAGAMRNALIVISRNLPYESIRRRVEKFREASAAFVGVQPAFSNTPTLPDMRQQAREQPAKLTEPGPPAPAPSDLDSFPAVPTTASRSGWLLIGATTVAVIAALAAIIFALSMRERVQELEAAAAENAAEERERSKVPSLDDWKLEDAGTSGAAVSAAFDAGPDATVADAAAATWGETTNPYEKSTPETDLRAARRVLDKNPAAAARLLRRAIRNGGNSDRYRSELAKAYCALKDRRRWQQTVDTIKGSSTKRLAMRRCAALGRDRDAVMNPFDTLE